MELFVPPRQSASSLIVGIVRPLVIFAVIIAAIFLLLKAVTKNLNMDFDFSTDTQSTSATIGAQAESVRVEPNQQPQAPSKLKPQAVARTAEIQAKNIRPQVATEPQALPDQLATVSIAEAFIPEASRGASTNTVFTNEPQILNTFYSETLNIRNETVPLRFEDEFFIYEITLQVTDFKEAKNTFKIIARRTLKTPTAQAIAPLETTETLDLPSYAIIKDTLPRDQRLRPVSNLLNVLARSETYRALASELAIVVHFEPANLEMN